MRNSIKIGFWASVVAAFALLMLSACFIIILTTQKVSIWTDIHDYIDMATKNNQTLKYIAQFCALVFGISYLIILHCIVENISTWKKIFAKISTSFGTAFLTLIGINYFLQLTYVRFGIESDNTAGLEQWVMFNPNSISLSIAMLGWTLIFGLSSLFASLAIKGTRLAKTICILFLLNGLFCLLGSFGFVFQFVMLVNFTMNIGMGYTMTVLSICLSIYFGKKIIGKETKNEVY